jgi:predicted metal-binding protein
MSTVSDHTLLICSTCHGPAEARRLKSLLQPLLPAGVGLRAVDCMAGCDHPVAVGLQAEGKASYLFGPIESAVDVAALGDFAHQYLAHDTGWTSASDRPMALYHKTLARMPALKPSAGGQHEGGQHG